MIALGLIQIRDVPEDVHRTLKARAAGQGTSLSAYVLKEILRLARTPMPEDLDERIRSRGVPASAPRTSSPRVTAAAGREVGRDALYEALAEALDATQVRSIPLPVCARSHGGRLRGGHSHDVHDLREVRDVVGQQDRAVHLRGGRDQQVRLSTPGLRASLCHQGGQSAPFAGNACVYR